MLENVPMSKIVANPYRHMENYPINQEKVDLLVASMAKTGFWENMIGRERNGHVELAYGHHRWIAYKKRHKNNASMPINIRNVSNEDMIRIMADENMHEWGTSAEIEQETIRAVVLAYADGDIKLEKPKSGDHSVKGWRIAPSFLRVKKSDFDIYDVKIKFYNAKTIAKFLGWTQPDGQVSPRVRNALDALENSEKILKEIGREEAEEFDDLSKGGIGSDQASELRKSVSTIRRDRMQMGENKKQATRNAIKDVNKIAKNVRSKKLGVRGVREEAKKVRTKVTKKPERLPMVEEFCQSLSKEIVRLLSKKDERWKDLNEVVKFRGQIDADIRSDLIINLRSLSERCIRMADAIEASEPKQKLIA